MVMTLIEYNRSNALAVPMLPIRKETSMQCSGTWAILLSKREITKITNSQNTKRTHGQPNEQLFPERWPPSNPNRTKHKEKRHVEKTLTPVKIRQQRTTTEPYALIRNWINRKPALKTERGNNQNYKQSKYKETTRSTE